METYRLPGTTFHLEVGADEIHSVVDVPLAVDDIQVKSSINGLRAKLNCNSQQCFQVLATGIILTDLFVSTCVAKEGGMLYVPSNSELTLQNVNVAYCRATNNGGAIFNAGTLRVRTASCWPFDSTLVFLRMNPCVNSCPCASVYVCASSGFAKLVRAMRGHEGRGRHLQPWAVVDSGNDLLRQHQSARRRRPR